jgi:hypothetical protein
MCHALHDDPWYQNSISSLDDKTNRSINCFDASAAAQAITAMIKTQAAWGMK